MTPAAEKARMFDDIEPISANRGEPLHPRVRRLRDLSLIVLAFRAGIPLPTESQVTGLPNDETLARIWADWESRHAQRTNTARPRDERARSERRRLDGHFKTGAAPSRWRTVVPRTVSIVIRLLARWRIQRRRNSASR